MCARRFRRNVPAATRMTRVREKMRPASAVFSENSETAVDRERFRPRARTVSGAWGCPPPRRLAATPRARAADVGAEGDPPAHAGGSRGDRGGGVSPEDASLTGGEQSPPPRYFAAESFDGDDAGGVAGNDAPASPVADRREEDDSDDGRGNGGRGSHASRGSPVARVRTPDLKLRRPKPKQSAYHVVIKPRTPSPEPPTPPPSHPATPAVSESESESEDERYPPSPERAAAARGGCAPGGEEAEAHRARRSQRARRLRGRVLRRGVRVRRAGDDRSRAPPQRRACSIRGERVRDFFRCARRVRRRRNAARASAGSRARAPDLKPRRRMTRFRSASASHLPIELARVTLSAYDLLPDGDLDEAFVARLAKVDVGDWVPAPPPRAARACSAENPRRLRARRHHVGSRRRQAGGRGPRRELGRGASVGGRRRADARVCGDRRRRRRAVGVRCLGGGVRRENAAARGGARRARRPRQKRNAFGITRRVGARVLGRRARGHAIDQHGFARARARARPRRGRRARCAAVARRETVGFVSTEPESGGDFVVGRRRRGRRAGGRRRKSRAASREHRRARRGARE